MLKRRTFPELVTANLRVPSGQAGFWRVMLELDRDGPWTVGDIEARTNSQRVDIRDYVLRLARGGFAELAGEQARSLGKPIQSFRLLRKPAEAPRLGRDGSELPEPHRQTLWRTMKMAKAFTARELQAASVVDERGPSLSYVRGYLSLLLAAGVITEQRPARPNVEGSYRLARNLGQDAPMILFSRLLYDPNAHAVLDGAEAREVRP